MAGVLRLGSSAEAVVWCEFGVGPGGSIVPASIEIACFSDVLCVWAYVAQVRLDKLRDAWGEHIRITHRYINLFGDTATRIGAGWAGRGGYAGFGQHVVEVCASFPQVRVSPDVWALCRPCTSGNAHLLLKAAQLLEQDDRIPPGAAAQLAWALRLAFFRDARDIAEFGVVLDVAAQCGLEPARLEALCHSGAAMAALQRDQTLKEQHQIAGSPTYVLNDGRQKLFGNVGYRILDANVRELLERPETGASWC